MSVEVAKICAFLSLSGIAAYFVLAWLAPGVMEGWIGFFTYLGLFWLIAYLASAGRRAS